MKVGFLSLDWSASKDAEGMPTPGGACYYRAVMPARWLADNTEHEVVVGPNLACEYRTGELILQGWDKKLHDGLDIVVLQRWMDEHAPEMIRRARAYGQVIINDVDDWFDGLDTTNAAWRASHPRANRRSNREHYRRVLASSSALTVSTPYLAERLRPLGAPIHVVRNAIDLDRFKPQEAGREPFTVGWVGGTAHRSRDLEQASMIGPWLAQVDGEFFHGGGHKNWTPAAELLTIPDSVFSSSLPVCSIYDCGKFYEYFNVGIVPLSDTPFNHAKSCIKGMEYAAAGLPFVATPTPEYKWLAEEHGVYGMPAKRARDWPRRLASLRNPEIRRDIGATNRQAVAALDINLRGPDWARVYGSLR